LSGGGRDWLVKGEMMSKCKECGQEIKGKGKTGLCKSCVHKAKNMKKTKGLYCSICGEPLADWNKTGRCQKCWHSKGGNTNVLSKPKRVKIRCCNSHCRKLFYARPDQHPKYSLCPTCKAAKEVMSRNGRWVHDAYFSNATE